MHENSIDPGEGRHLFGRDPVLYEQGRPDYPELVFEILEQRCGLGHGCRVFEIGAGSGKATRRLLRSGPSALTALEPDQRFAAALRSIEAPPGVEFDVRFEVFEHALAPPRAFDLVVAATSFHWIQQQSGLDRIANWLHPGGWVALFWNVFGDPDRADPFHDATQSLLAPLGRSPSHGKSTPFALDSSTRIRELEASGAFRDISMDRIEWTLELDPAAVRLLYSTFSNIARLADPERETLLDQLSSIARSEFGGIVYRNMVTPIYTAQRRDL